MAQSARPFRLSPRGRPLAMALGTTYGMRAALAGLGAARQTLWGSKLCEVTRTQRRRAHRKRANAANRAGAHQNVWTPVAKHGTETTVVPPCPSGSQGGGAMRCLTPLGKRCAEDCAAVEERSVRQRSSERGRQQREVLRDDDSVEVVHITNPPPADSEATATARDGGFYVYHRCHSRASPPARPRPRAASGGKTKSSLGSKNTAPFGLRRGSCSRLQDESDNVGRPRVAPPRPSSEARRAYGTAQSSKRSYAC